MSVTGKPRNKPGRSRGFTLLELLLVLFVVALVTSLASLSLNSGGQDIRLENQVRELGSVAQYALDEAQANGIDMGLRLERRFTGGEPTYHFEWLQRSITGWRAPQPSIPLYDAGQFPAGLVLSLELDDLPVPDLEPDPQVEQAPPQIYFYASGETTPGVLEFRDETSGDVLWRLDWDLLGRFRYLPRGEESLDDDTTLRSYGDPAS